MFVELVDEADPRAGDIVLHRSDRGSLVLAPDGRCVVVSPKGNRYPLEPNKPHLTSIYAVWLSLTSSQLEALANAERS